MAEVDWKQIKKNVNKLVIWTYWIVGIIIVFTISYVLFTRFNKQVASILVFMASMMAMYYYYVKWFIVGQPFPKPAQTCPDFLESIGTIGTGQTVCVARNQVYPKFRFTAVGNDTTTKTEAAKGTGNADGVVVSDGAGVAYVLTPTANGRLESYCGKLKEKGLSHVSLCSFV